MPAYFLSLICEIWMWIEFEFEFICLLYFIWIYMPAVFFLIQEIIYRGGQIIKPTTANEQNRGGPQKVLPQRARYTNRRGKSVNRGG